LTWISVATDAGAGEIAVPEPIWPFPKRTAEVTLRYGALEAPALLKTCEGMPPDSAGVVPVVHIGPDLAQRLAFRLEPVYQIKVSRGIVDIGPVLGFLMGDHAHIHDQSYMRVRPGRVMEAYPRTGGLYLAVSARTVSLAQRCAYGLFYDPSQAAWRFGRVPVPAVLYRRSYLQPPRMIERLRQFPRLRVFNSRRFDKWELHQVLSRDWLLRRYLPKTAPAVDGTEVRAMVARYGGAVLKPRDLSRGRGVLFVEPDGGGSYLLIRHRTQGRAVTRPLDRAELDAAVSGSLTRQGYLCQRRLRLATASGQPFDIRVVMQRGSRGAWRCGGIECRVAGEGRLVTNISAGGNALWLDDAIKLAFGHEASPAAIERKLVALSRRVCSVLDSTGEDFGELGLDLALDSQARIWLIEANVLPTFYGFRYLSRQVHRRLLRTPLEYACCQAGFELAPPGTPVPSTRTSPPAPPAAVPPPAASAQPVLAPGVGRVQAWVVKIVAARNPAPGRQQETGRRRS
jgi:hypothetical protein